MGRVGICPTSFSEMKQKNPLKLQNLCNLYVTTVDVVKNLKSPPLRFSKGFLMVMSLEVVMEPPCFFFKFSTLATFTGLLLLQLQTKLYYHMCAIKDRRHYSKIMFLTLRFSLKNDIDNHF